MLRTLLVAGLAAISLASAASADEFVNGYTRRDGTYVAPHYRSSPDSSYNNNWSVAPNVNPYTGQMGTRAPTWNDQPPVRAPNPYSYTAPTYSTPYGSRRY